MIVVAVAEDEVAAAKAALSEVDVTVVQIVELLNRRSLLLGAAQDEWAAAGAVARLRAAGAVVVNRPDDGPRLAAWIEDTRPITFAERITVCCAWSEHDRDGRPGIVEIGTGGFGNGRHPTTGMLIETMIERVRGGDRVLDVGCGSGILGLCALRLGADSVLAVDLKPDAIEATGRNAVLNRVADRVTAALAPLQTVDSAFDVIVANVARAATVELAPQLVRLLAPGGWLAVSGISPAQCDQVAAFLDPLVEVERRTIDEWSVLILARR